MIAHDASWHVFAGLAMLSSYLVFACGLHWLISASRLFPAGRPGERLATALLFGPIAGAWTFGAALRLFPSMPASFYLAVCIGIWLAAGFAGWRALRADIAAYWAILARRRRNRTSQKAAVLLFLAFGSGITLVLWVNARVPPYANDPLEYLTMARLVAGKLALAGIYPAIDTNATSGFYGPWTHPPGFVLLMSWIQVLQGDTFSAGAVKFMNVYFLAAGALLVFVYAGGALRFRGAVAALLYATTPIILGEVFEHHVDVSRVAFWAGAFLAVAYWARRPALASSLLLGMLFGLGSFVHSIGLTALPIFTVLALIVSKGSFQVRATSAVVVIFTALAVIAPDILTNLRTYGRLIGDRVELWDHAPLMVSEHLRYARGINTPFEIVTLGVLSAFTRPAIFGISHWVALGLLLPLAAMRLVFFRKSVADLVRRSMRPTVFAVAAFAWLGFFGITVLTVIGGSELIIKNARYALTTIAFVCVFGVHAGDMLLRMLSRTRLRWRRADSVAQLHKDGVASPFRSQIGSWFFRTRRLRKASRVPVVAALILAAGFSALVFLQSARTLRYANVDSLTAFQPDQTKAGMADFPQSRLISRLNRKLADGSWAPRGKVLSLRVSDIAYYARFDYLSYIDPAALPAFKAGSAEEAGALLSRIGVSYVATPPYSMPEIYNSAIGALLANPALTRIIDSDEGFTLYELLGDPERPATRSIATDLPLSVIDSPKAELLQMKSLAPMKSSDDSLQAQTGELDTGFYVRWSRAERAYYIGTPLNSENGEHLFSARMSGSGFVRIALMRQATVVNVLWEGLVPGEEKLVSSHFDLAHFADAGPENSKGPEAGYGIGIWLKSGSRVRIRAASLERIAGRASSEVVRVNYLSQLLRSGYSFGVNGIAPSKLANLKKIARNQSSIIEIANEVFQLLRLKLGFNQAGFPVAKLEIVPSPSGFSVLNLDGRKLSVDFPKLILPDGELGRQLYPQGRLSSAASLGGTGLREVSISVECNQFKIHPADEYRDVKVFGRRYVMADADQEYEFESDVPCMAKSARVSVDMWRATPGSDVRLPPLAYRFGANRMSFGYTDSSGAWRTRELLPLTTPR